MRTKFLRGLAILSGIGLFLLLALQINQRVALNRVRAEYPAPGQLIAVDGRQMHLHCTGSGAPTVVIDAGNGCFSAEWLPLQAELQTLSRVCVYDRAGYGWSETATTPRDGEQAVEELHALLQAAGAPGPYLLVGHSLGGIHARIYAARYPDEVAGLVLIETAAETTLTPDFEQQMQASIGFYQVMRLLSGSGLLRILGPLGGEQAMPETARGLPPEYRVVYLELLLDPQQYATAIGEMEQLPQTLRQLEIAQIGAQPLGDRPLIVLSAGQMAAPGSTPFDAARVPVPADYLTAQARLATLSSRGENRIIPESGHQLHLDAPEAVITAVGDVLALLRE